MQSSLFYYKNSYYVVLLWGGIFLYSQTVHSESFLQERAESSYVSEGKQLSERKVYSFYQLMKLRRGLSPRYIRVFNPKQYAFRAKMIQKGILFSYGNSPRASVKKVSLAGNFNNWLEIPMRRNHVGTFFYILPIEAKNKQTVYRYKFIVDGVWQHDPNNSYRLSDTRNAYYSIFYFDKKIIDPQSSLRIYATGKGNKTYWVEFSIYLPKVRNLALVADFNNWNIEHDSMIAQGNGLFRRKVKLEAGEYSYKFIADGKWILDTYNPNTRFDPNIRELVSFLKVP